MRPMGFSTVRDLADAVAERLGVDRTEALEDACRDATPGRYEDVELTDAFLRQVWAATMPLAAYPWLIDVCKDVDQ